MKKINFYLTFSLIFFTNALVFAQKQSNKLIIEGIVADSLGVALDGAGAFLVRDSSVIALQQTNSKGVFRFETTMQPITLRLTYVGMETYEAALTPPLTGNEIKVGVIRLRSVELEGVTVKADKIPIKINKDTIEFNATAFKTEPNAAAEDLVKKLPGVEIDKSGNVTAQGERVQKVRVNGKEFFGSDPKMALQNIPADAIDKVKVYDKKSDASEFSGVDDGSRERTIDLTLKADRSNGKFGNFTIGGGVDNDKNLRYSNKGAFNSFAPKRQLSFVGQGNNVNRQGFSFNEYSNFSSVGNSGGGGQGGGGGGMRTMMREGNDGGLPIDFGASTGYTTTWASGLNFNSDFSPTQNRKSELNGAYFFNFTDKNTVTKTNRQNFLQTGDFASFSSADARTKNWNHRGNFAFDQYIDSLHSFKWTGNFNKTDNNNLNDNINQNFRKNINPDALQNANVRDAATTGGGYNFSTSLLMRKKFIRRGRTLTATATVSKNNSDNQTNVSAINNYYFPSQRTDSLQQDDRRVNERIVLNGNVSYTEPLSKKEFLEINYSYQDIASDAQRLLYETRNSVTTLNTRLSNNFQNSFLYHKSGLTYRYNDKSVTFSTGVQYQGSTLKSYNATRDTNLRAGFDNFIPNLRAQINPKIGQNFVLEYNASVNEPSITQLQPIVDNTDPLNVSEGNPNLIPEYSHNIRLRANQFNMGTTAGFFSFGNIRFVKNRIVTAQYIDDRLIRRSKPVNILNGGFDASAQFNYSMPLDSARKYRISFGPSGSYGRTKNLINDIENNTDRYTAAIRLNFDQRRGEKFTWGVNTSLQYNLTTYDLQSSFNQAFYSNNISTDFEYKMTKALSVRSDLNYAFWRGGGFDRDIPLWNASVSYQFLKNNRGELRLAAVDLLNQNVGISRTADVNYIQNQQVTSLGRHVLLTFTYAVRPLGRGNGMPEGGGMRMMRFGG
ncbi:MAG: hypothetical protein RL757_1433 [Bacteroidota bacterium]|jgi:hypothetical protein